VGASDLEDLAMGGKFERYVSQTLDSKSSRKAVGHVPNTCVSPVLSPFATALSLTLLEPSSGNFLMRAGVEAPVSG